ncbi:MAG: hypothetical protein CL694_14330 [Chloroflexi bacterium]|nr:hypothetical protein [Chloroflexota bacterium]
MIDVSKRDIALAAIVALAGIVIGVYIVVFRDAAPDKADQLRGHNARGVSLMQTGQLNDAVEEFQKAVDLDPEYVYGHINLGIAYFHSGADDRARQTLSSVEALDPVNAHLNYVLARLDLLQGQEAAAIERFNEVLRLDPNDAYTNYYLGKIYFDAGRIPEARERLEKAIQVDGSLAAAHYNLGLVLLQAGDEKRGLNEMLTYNKFVIRRSADELGQRVYLEEGIYARAVEDPDGPSDAATASTGIGVRFADVVASSGIQFVHGAAATPEFEPGQRIASDPRFLREHVAPYYGSGAAFLDFDGDGHLDLYVVNAGPTEASSGNALYRNERDGTFADVTSQAGVGHTGQGMGVAFGDFDNDRDPDLYITNFGPDVLYRNDGDGTFTDITVEAGIDGAGFGMGATFVDYDHDGFLDLFVANYVDARGMTAGATIRFPQELPGQCNVLYRNTGDGAFVDMTVEAGLDGIARSVTPVFLDYDGDNDTDLYLGNDGQPGVLYSNNRDGSFADVTTKAGLAGVTASRGVAAGDYNGDSFVDLLVNSGTTNGVWLLSNRGDGSFAADASFQQAAGAGEDRRAWGASFVDYDNDGYLDVMLVVDQPEGAVVLYRNLGDGGFVDATADVGLQGVGGAGGRGLTLGDHDSDGDVDVFVVRNGANPMLLENEGGARNTWLKVTTVGDGSNRMGLGSKVEVKAGGRRQKREVSGGSGYLSQNSPNLLFGLGEEQQIGMVHVLWPSGLRQRPNDVAVNQALTVTEQGRKSSCPLLYTWDGDQYTFISDFLGAGFIGILVGPDTYYQPDSDEYVKVDGRLLRERDGKYTIRITEQLEEVSYLDQVRLLVVDHPSDTEVYPNEVLKMGPPFPEFEVHVTGDARPPVSATDGDGRDILSAISEFDRAYPTFQLLPYQGIAKSHSVVLDLGDLSGAERVLLLMDGWIEYWNSESVRQALDDGIALQAPILQVWRDDEGRWVTVIEDLGFPAGLPKTMTVDLTGVFPSDDYRVRIATNMEVYWDRIRVSTANDVAAVNIATLKPDQADLHWRGYPKLHLPDGNNPPVFLYDQPNDSAPLGDQAGYYTRFGDVTPLLDAPDDQYVIMHHGEEIAISFSADEAGPLPQGWKRDFLVYVDGYVKDMWADTAYGSTVAPLPFHDMSSYPYTDQEAYPDDRRRQEYLREYNTRWIGRSLP